jgi:2-oxoglutarate ferredoxin oxidoreductase subunit beta
MFNNEVYSLTKGQYSPTSHRGQITKSSPLGALDEPFNPISLALGAGATFVARGHDRDRNMLQNLLEKAAKHKGVAFLEIYTNCRIFNDGAFELYTSKETGPDNTVWLEDGQPLVFGKNRDKGIILDGFSPKQVSLADGAYSVNDLLVHNEKDSTLAFILANMSYNPDLPRPVGVFQAIVKPSYEELVDQQIRHEIETRGEGTMEELLAGKTNWVVGQRNRK